MPDIKYSFHLNFQEIGYRLIYAELHSGGYSRLISMDGIVFENPIPLSEYASALYYFNTIGLPKPTHRGY